MKPYLHERKYVNLYKKKKNNFVRLNCFQSTHSNTILFSFSFAIIAPFVIAYFRKFFKNCFLHCSILNFVISYILHCTCSSLKTAALSFHSPRTNHSWAYTLHTCKLIIVVQLFYELTIPHVLWFRRRNTLLRNTYFCEYHINNSFVFLKLLYRIKLVVLIRDVI